MRSVTKPKVVSALNHLIRTCKDGQNSFHDAGAEVHNRELKKLYLAYEYRHRMLLAQLQPQVLVLGGAPRASGTVAATLRRAWLNLTQLLSGASDEMLIDEAERGEGIAVRSYAAALRKELPPDIRSLVERQYDEVRRAHDRLFALKKVQHLPDRSGSA
jgi:uncharacterized protein (TIGR02284 family)